MVVPEKGQPCVVFRPHPKFCLNSYNLIYRGTQHISRFTVEYTRTFVSKNVTVDLVDELIDFHGFINHRVHQVS
jgi:hypothetical protein